MGIQTYPQKNRVFAIGDQKNESEMSEYGIDADG